MPTKNINYKNNRFLMFVLDAEANKLEKQGKKVIRLTLGKSELPMNKKIIDRILKGYRKFDEYKLVYPAGLPELKQALSRHYAREQKVRIDPENIVISTGTSAIFRNIYQVVLRPGDEVLIPRPYYSLYKFCATILGIKVRYYDIDLKDLSVDFGSFEKSFNRKTKIVVVNSPGNPLGNILTREEFIEMDKIVDGGAYIISDEIYTNMSFAGQPPTVLEIFGFGKKSKAKSKFIITNSFSKGYRMYSRRIGWCVAPEELVRPLSVIQHHTLLTADPIMQFAGIEALKTKTDVNNLQKTYKKRRDYTWNKFKDHQLVRPIRARGSFYFTIDCARFMKKKGFKTTLDLCLDIIRKKKVAVVPGSDFGLPKTIRLSYTSKDYEKGIGLLFDYFDKH